MRHRPGTLGSASTSWPATTASSDRRLGLLLCELRAVERVEHPLGVGDQIIYEPRPLVGVVPVTHRPGPSVVVMAQHQPSRRRRQAAHTPNLRADHRDGVLTQVATASNSTVESSARIVLFDSAPHRRRLGPRAPREDPLRAPAGAQPLAPQRQHARIEAPVADAQPRRGLPAHIAAQPLQRLAVRTPAPAPAEPSPPRSPTPAPTTAPAARRDPRTTRQETTSGGSRPRTDAPTPPAPGPPQAQGVQQ